jgi:hypothetical protein
MVGGKWCQDGRALDQLHATIVRYRTEALCVSVKCRNGLPLAAVGVPALNLASGGGLNREQLLATRFDATA